MQLSFYQTGIIAVITFGSVTAALDPNCRPGGNFDLSKWDLETPIDNGHGQPLVIPAATLSGGSNGCSNGWQDKGPDHQWFFTVSTQSLIHIMCLLETLCTFANIMGLTQESTDGSMVMKAPGYSAANPCIKWSGSNHCRTELHESTPSSWSPNAATNRLHVKLVGIRGSEVCIGQVFQSGSSANKPYAELYYRDDGTVFIGVATCPGGADDGCKQDTPMLGTVPLGTPFSYDIWYEGNVLKAGINGNMKTLTTYFNTPGAFFKAGNYDQGTDDASVHILELTTQHA